MSYTDAHFLALAYQEAQASRDPSTQNGAVIVGPADTVVGRGCNNFPDKVEETPDRWERPAKYQFIEHAERNSIYCASFFGMPTRGCTMYCPWSPCADCARAIIQAGIVELVGHDLDVHRTRDTNGGSGNAPSWGPSIDTGLQMLKEAGVVHRVVRVQIGMTIRFNGITTEV